MTVLFLSQAYEIVDQMGFDAAFRAALGSKRLSHYINIPYLGYAQQHGWPQLWNHVQEIVFDHQVDLIFIQFFHGSVQTHGMEEAILRLRKHHPRLLIFTSAGDAFTGSCLIRPPSSEFSLLSRLADASFLTSMGGFAERLARQGAHNLIFLPHAFSEKSFSYGSGRIKDTYRFDVMMVASVGFSPRNRQSWINLWRRWRIADHLYQRYGSKFGLFGHGWGRHPAYQGCVDYLEQVDLFQQSRLVVDGRGPSDETYYASDRPFYIAGSGTPLVQFHTPRFEKILHPDRHAYYAKDEADVCRVCDRVLTQDVAITQTHIQDTLALIRARHTLDVRVATLLMVAEVLWLVREGQLTSKAAYEQLAFQHFLPDIHAEEEKRFAVINWSP